MPTIDLTPDLVATDSPTQPEQGGVLEVDLNRIVETLSARTADENAARVRTLVEEIAHQFDNARVRDFLSVLILKEAGDQLRALGLMRKFAV